jgi:hypothetical protein
MLVVGHIYEPSTPDPAKAVARVTPHISLCIHHQIAALLTHSPKRILGLSGFAKAAI